MKPIIHEVHKLPSLADDMIGTVMVTTEAEQLSRQLVREFELSMRTVVPQFIIQSAPYAEVHEVK